MSTKWHIIVFFCVTTLSISLFIGLGRVVLSGRTHRVALEGQALVRVDLQWSPRLSCDNVVQADLVGPRSSVPGLCCPRSCLCDGLVLPELSASSLTAPRPHPSRTWGVSQAESGLIHTDSWRPTHHCRATIILALADPDVLARAALWHSQIFL